MMVVDPGLPALRGLSPARKPLRRDARPGPHPPSNEFVAAARSSTATRNSTSPGRPICLFF